MINFLIIAVHVGLTFGAFQLFSIGTLAISISDFSMILFILIIGFRLIWNAEIIYLPRYPAFYFLCGVMVAVVVSGLTPLLIGNPGELNQYFKTTGHFLYIWLFTLFCCIIKIDIKVITSVVKLTIFVALFINIFGIYQVAARAFDWPFAWIEMTNVSIGGRGANMEGNAGQLSLQFGSFFRATSIFSEPSALASFCVAVLIYILMPFSLGQRQFLRSNIITTLVFISLVMALFLAFSLTGLLTGGLVVAASLVFGKRQRIIQVSLVLVTGIVLIVIADRVVSSYSGISVVDLFATRVGGIINGGESQETIVGESFFTRWESIIIALDIWSDYPINGKGLGLYSYAEQAIKHGYGFPDSTLAAAFAELGLIGFIAVAGLNISLTVHTIFLLTRKNLVKKLSPDVKRLFAIIPFILVTTAVGTAIGNSLVNLWMWLSIAFCFPVYNAVLRESGYEFTRFQLLKTPLREKFLLAMGQKTDLKSV